MDITYKPEVLNCPNCGAPMRGRVRCEYCGTVVDSGVHVNVIRPGIRKIQAEVKAPVDRMETERMTKLMTGYAMRAVRDQIAEGLQEAIKYRVGKDYDFERGQEIILVRGELYVADPDVRW